MALRLTAALGERVGRQLSVSFVFRDPTVAGMAASLREARPQRPSLFQLDPGADGTTLFIGGSSRRLGDLAGALQPGPAVYQMDVYALQEARALAGQALCASVPEMAADFLGQIRAVQPHGPYRLAGFSFGGVLAYEVAQQLRAAGEFVDQQPLHQGRQQHRRRCHHQRRHHRDTPSGRWRLGFGHAPTVAAAKHESRARHPGGQCRSIRRVGNSRHTASGSLGSRAGPPADASFLGKMRARSESPS